jgi:hypothetical protein
MFTRIGTLVNRRQQVGFDLLGSRVEVALAVGAGLRRKPDYRDVRAHVLGEPVSVHA